MLRRPSRYIPRRNTTVYLHTTCVAWELLYTAWKPRLRRRALGRFRVAGDALCALGKRSVLMPKRPSASGPEGLQLMPHVSCHSWHDKYPMISSYCADPTWDDGKTRKPARLFITPINGQWEFSLKEPNLGLLLSVSVDDPEEGLTLLEVALSSTTPPWRPDQWAPANRKTKGK